MAKPDSCLPCSSSSPFAAPAAHQNACMHAASCRRYLQHDMAPQWPSSCPRQKQLGREDASCTQLEPPLQASHRDPRLYASFALLCPPSTPDFAEPSVAMAPTCCLPTEPALLAPTVTALRPSLVDSASCCVATLPGTHDDAAESLFHLPIRHVAALSPARTCRHALRLPARTTNASTRTMTEMYPTSLPPNAI